MSERSYEKELLDGDDLPFNEALVMLKELNTVNTFLGGHKITCEGVDFFLKNANRTQHLVIAEIGCGGGDNLIAIQRHLTRLAIPVSLIGIDIKPECIAVAKERVGGDATWLCSDYQKIVWPVRTPDIIFSSLFCHHFTDDELVGQLKWMKNNSKLGFFINDLHRHPLAYYSFKLISGLFSKSEYVKNDGPLSVRRAFKRQDWVNLFALSGIERYTLKWKWAFRYLICCCND